MNRIHRQFARVGGRHVHFRHAGAGPALLLLHQSPQNSSMWEGAMQRLAPHCLVVAPDTPYFGFSDPLPSDAPSIADLAEATRELADVLGLERFAVMGMHTGGLIAAELALRHPGRVSGLIVDGYAAFSPQEAPLYGERYLPPFRAAWDGSHLCWLWARMREQKYFFPWYEGTAHAAMAIDPHDTGSTHAAVMEVLETGDAYRAGYAAAFRHTDHSGLTQLNVPTWLLYQRNDPLQAHRARLPELPPHVRCELLDDTAALATRVDAIVREVLSGEPEQTIAGGQDLREDTWLRKICPTTLGEVACWQRSGDAPLRVIVHAPGTRPMQPHDPGNKQAMLLIDLPGHGASTPFHGALDAATMVHAMASVVEAESSGMPVVLEAHGAAAGYVPELVEALARQIHRVELHDPWLLDDSELAIFLGNLPDLDPKRAGGHLGEAWQWERERHLLLPWMPASASARVLRDAPQPEDVHANAVELLRIGHRLHELFAGALKPDLGVRLQRLGIPVLTHAALSMDGKDHPQSPLPRTKPENTTP